MEGKVLSVTFGESLGVKSINFCKFNDCPEDLAEIKAVKSFKNKADQGTQTEAIGEVLNWAIGLCVVCVRTEKFVKENTSTLILIVVTMLYGFVLLCHAEGEFVVFENSVFVYGLDENIEKLQDPAWAYKDNESFSLLCSDYNLDYDLIYEDIINSKNMLNDSLSGLNKNNHKKPPSQNKDCIESLLLALYNHNYQKFLSLKESLQNSPSGHKIIFPQSPNPNQSFH